MVQLLEDRKLKKDNTVGRLTKIDLAYIAGFLDGDGSLMIQLKSRIKDKLPHRLMFTICFYQDSRHEETLYWIREKLQIGYLFKRNDGMTELRINGYSRVSTILRMLLPYLRFKKIQAKAIYDASRMLCRRKFLRKLSYIEKEKLISQILIVQNENYKSRYKKSETELKSALGIIPVTTSS